MSAAPERVRFAAGIVPLRHRGISFLLTMRSMLVCGVLLASCLIVLLLSLVLGEYPLTLSEVGAALRDRTESIASTVVWRWRLPRALAALLLGAALGVSGAIFQSLTRNPLGSPDVIGFSSGSFTGALVVIILLGGGYLQVALGAVLGGCATALAVYVLAFRHGVQGFRLIVVGIAVSAILSSLNTWMMIAASQDVALTATVWGVGSLNGVGWEEVSLSAAVLGPLVLCTLALARPMRTLELGDDLSRSLGIRAELVRLALVVVGVATTAVVAAAAGPISFVSLAAPQIAKRLTGSPSVSPAAAGITGALLLALADLLSQRLMPPGEAMPVGVVTVSIGGVYLIWLILREARRGR